MDSGVLNRDMKFPVITAEGQTFGLLLIQPNWDSPIEVAHRCDTLIGEGRTSIEERRPESAATSLSIKFHLTAADDEADDWRKGLAALGNNPVAIPLWPDARPVADWDNRIYDPQKVINFDPDTGDYAIYAASSLPGSPAYPLYAPLMLCRWTERPKASAQDETDSRLKVPGSPSSAGGGILGPLLVLVGFPMLVVGGILLVWWLARLL